jgi:hypothetical protein
MTVPKPPRESASAREKTYRWPWFVLLGVLLGLLLAVLWMSGEVGRMRLIREANTPPPAKTNSAR